MNKRKEPKIFKKEIFKYFSLLGQIGFIIALNLIFSIFVYKCFEKYFCENVFVLMLCIIVGIFNGFYRVYKLITE